MPTVFSQKSRSKITYIIDFLKLCVGVQFTIYTALNYQVTDREDARQEADKSDNRHKTNLKIFIFFVENKNNF